MREAIPLVAVFMGAFLILGVVLTSTLKGCADAAVHESESALAYKMQFQNANEHEVYVRRLGDK